MSTEQRNVLPLYPDHKRHSMKRVAILLVASLLAAEVALFCVVGHYVCWEVLVGVSVLTAVLGIMVTGFAILRYGNGIAARLDHDQALDDRLFGGLLLALAVILLLLPGLLSHALALFLFLPPTRRLVASLLRRQFGQPLSDAPAPATYPRAFVGDIEGSEKTAEEIDSDAPCCITLPSNTRAA